MEETLVRARSTAATEAPSGSKELGDQIARLMAALTRAEQSTCSASAPSSPRHRGHGRGWTDRHTPACTKTPTMVGLAWAKPLPAAPLLSKVVPNPHARGIKMCRPVHQVAHRVTRGSSSLQCYRCQGWGHMARECATPAMQLNREGGTQGNAVKPPLQLHAQ